MIKTLTLRILGVCAALLLVPAVGLTGAAATSGGDDSDKNHIEYWQGQGYGTCVKYDGLSDPTFTVPAAPAGSVYTFAVVKSGSSESVDEPNETDATVAAGDVLTHTSGKDLSHVILCSKPGVAAVAPTASQAQCNGTTPTTPTYTIPATANVVYSVDGTVKAAGTYNAAQGTTVTVTAAAASGYVLTGPSSFPLVFSSVTCTKTNATPATPTFSNSTCATNGSANNASYTIVAATGVDYYVGDVKKAPGTYAAADGSSVTITPRAQDSYQLTSATPFSHTFTAPTCTTTTTTSTTATPPATAVEGTKVESKPEAKVKGVKHSTKPRTAVLPHTGLELNAAGLAAIAVGLVLAGLALVTLPRRPAVAGGARRRG